MDDTLHTKFGNARINSCGRYHITSRKEGNHHKLLHRLIWEDFYNCSVPDGFHIHHKNGNQLDNYILNLQLMRASEHLSLHNKGKNHKGENNPMYDKTHSEDSKKLMSEAKKGEKAYQWKHYARIVKSGFCNGKQMYTIKYNGEQLNSSMDIHKLVDWWNENCPTESVHVELNGCE